MPVGSDYVEYRLSGGASNASGAASLGGAKSGTAAMSQLFDNVSSTEAAAGLVEYRCVYVHAKLDVLGAKAWIPSNTPNAGTIVEIGLGTSAVGAVEQTIANERTAPADVTFSAALSLANAVSLGNMTAGQGRAVWLRRTVSPGAVGISSDPITLRTTGDPAA